MKKIDLLKDKLLFLQTHNGSPQEIAEIETKIAQSKRGKRSKNKGREYETDVRDIFKAKYPQLELVRTPASGGFQKSSDNEDLRGDVSNINKKVRFLLHLECKNQKTISIEKFMKQAESDCPDGKIPTVVYHRQKVITNGKVTQKAKDFICLPLSDFLEIVNEEAILKKVSKTIKRKGNN